MSEKPAGLYRKFKVERTDGQSAPGGKHHGCEYFVLDMNHDKHALAAIRAYIRSLAEAEECPELIEDLQHRYLSA